MALVVTPTEAESHIWPWFQPQSRPNILWIWLRL